MAGTDPLANSTFPFSTYPPGTTAGLQRTAVPDMWVLGMTPISHGMKNLSTRDL